MKQLQCVFNSDAINRKGEIYPAPVLVSALAQRWNTGVPMHIGHDMTRIAGWAIPIMVYFEPGLTRLAGINLLPESDAEMTTIISNQRNYIEKDLIDSCPKERIEELKKMLGKKLTGEESNIYASCVGLYRKGIASDVFPKIFDKRDKDGLVPLSELNYYGHGLFEKNGFVLFPHRMFRRSFSIYNNINYDFINRFISVLENTKSAEAWIALDTDIIGLASTVLQPLELEYWWGPKYSDDLTSIPSGVAKHESPEFEKFFNGIASTEFWWQSRDDKHILEVEELRDPTLDSGRAGIYGCRYIHSMVNEKTNTIEHLDGAVRGYEEEKMVQRTGVNINNAGKNTKYTKLWRVDGPLQVSNWKALISDYFRDNHLIGEYFGINKEEFSLPNILEEKETNSALHKIIPFSIDKGEGIRIAISFHQLSDHPEDNTSVFPLDYLTLDTERIQTIQCDTIEMIKAASRSGLKITIPLDTKRIAFEDLYTEFPLIKIAKNHIKDHLDKFCATIKLLMEASIKWGEDRVYSISIGIPMVDKELRVSIMGCSVDILKWIASPLSQLPTSMEELSKWSGNISLFLKEEFSSMTDIPNLSAIFKTSGILHFDRRLIKPTELQRTYSEEERGFVYDLKILKSESELSELLISQKVTICPSYIISSSKCNKCDSEYSECKCSKFLDEGVIQSIVDCEFAFPFYSDRPA